MNQPSVTLRTNFNMLTPQGQLIVRMKEDQHVQLGETVCLEDDGGLGEPGLGVVTELRDQSILVRWLDREVCPYCRGRGRRLVNQPHDPPGMRVAGPARCPDCQGYGYLEDANHV